MHDHDPKREMLRHAVATVAYRGAKALRGAPGEFAGFSGAGKTPAEILAHVGDLFEWALSMAQGKQKWKNSTPLAWEEEKARFFATLTAFDEYLGSSETVHAPAEKLFQGPVADALTHVGQIAMMRRLSGAPLRGENYYVAPVETGRVGADQAFPGQEF
jgi:hypothetical protein